MGFREEKIGELEGQKQRLLDMMRANREQQRSELSDARKITLQEEAMQLKREYDNCVANLERLRKGERLHIPPDRLRSDLVTSLHRKLPLIDFDAAEITFKELLGQFQDCDGAIVLVQSSEHRMGTLYLHRVRELLISKGGIHPFPAITFTSNDKTTKDELISRMCQSIGLSDWNTQDKDASLLVQVAQRLLNAVDAGRTLFLEISCEEMDPTFIKWLIHDFWAIFKNELIQIGHQKGRLRVVILLVTHFEFECDDELIPYICRELHMFRNQMIFEISLLTQWEENFIKNWLFEQLADELDYYGYPRSDLPNLARRVMQLSNGMPRQVCNEFTGTTLDWLINRLIPSTIAS
jgi:hypothetical protein